MKQLTRRLTALFLAMAMVMSFAAVASAASEDSSSDYSDVLTQQDNEAVMDAQDLYEDTSSASSEEKSSDASGEDESAPKEEQNIPDEEPDASGAETGDQSADQSSPAETGDESLVLQETAAGWAQKVNEAGESGFTLSYNEGSVAAQAAGGLYYVPEQTAQIDAVTWTFSAGVYEFDAQGMLVVGPYTFTENPVSVTVLAASGNALKRKSTDTLKLSITGETTVAETTVTSGAGFLTGVDEQQLWYLNGKLYTGYLRSSEAENPELLYGVRDGVATPFGGCMKKGTLSTVLSNNYVEGQTDYRTFNKFDELWYADGMIFTGFYENTSTKYMYLLREGKLVRGKTTQSVYYTGLMETFEMDGTTYDAYAIDGVLQKDLNGKYYQQGLPLTGIPSYRPTDGEYPVMHMYKNGKLVEMDDGWYRAPRAAKEFFKPYVYYYFKNNVAISNKENVKLKAIQSGSYKDSGSYYYTFRADGTLVTNMFRYLQSKNPGSLKSGQFRIYCDHTNYTGTVLMYNSKDKKTNGGWNIPIKSFVIAMSKSKTNGAWDGTDYGDYPLARGSSSWYLWTNSRTGAKVWYSGSVHIWGSGSMFHCSNYALFSKSTPDKKRRHMMRATVYNRIGKGITRHCVRVQTVNVRMINKMLDNSPKKVAHGRHVTKNVRVYLTRNNSKRNMPFGQMTLLNNFDFNGYILQKADTGYGKDMSFDPTDEKCIGDTIYVAKKKTSKKTDCVKAKMVGYKGYELAFDNA